MPPPTLPEAFKLVHQILSANQTGLHTKDIIRQGVALYKDKLPANAFIMEEPKDERKHKGKSKHVPEPKLVPRGHPFVSTSHLKNRVLPVLQSQNLIHKHIVHQETPPEPSTSKSKKDKPRPLFVWSLRDLPDSNLVESSWSTSEHWERLVGGEHPGAVGRDYELHQKDLRSAERGKAIDSGKVKRTEEEMWAWEDRKVGLTTNKERGHLNDRRQAARPAKERRRLDRWEKLFREGETA
ncbi:uncharacterized protein L203_103781 [Cryptococcus depauperatus CBS 7841]|uniref:Uncharacterized protein n=1 Tax=Cryptococcus depauperatus CBS 7841 TaxID=1295531 RepID=A0A1E3IED3_9TREE|nr:hypothetical protein L203_03720 [Cryptococcus depauperatus CBS 7841]